MLLEKIESVNQNQNQLKEEQLKSVEEFAWHLKTLGLTTNVLWRKTLPQWKDPEIVATILPF